MTQIIKKIEINDRELSMTYVNNQWWVAIKPICEALGVDYSRQLRTLKSDVFLGPAWSLQTMQVGIQKREMACIPEKYIYGWIFSLQSESEALRKYKQVCYDILYDYFHGELYNRIKILKQKTLNELELEEVKKEIESSATYQKYKQLKQNISSDKKALNTIDKNYVVTQLEIWTL